MNDHTDADNGDALSLNGVGKTYGEAMAVRSISAKVPKHKISVIVGPSGCGKSTLLRIISGLDTPTTGEVYFEDQLVVGVPEGLAMVFQEYTRSLFPWMRVRKNVAFPIRHLPAAERIERVQFALNEVGLHGKEHLYPWQMSGGMQQRVAIARALASHPKLLLMDEPFASVDAQTRAGLEDLLLRLQQELNITVVVVSHDIDESVYLADRIFALSAPPSVVSEALDVDLEHPRDQVTTKSDPRFVEIRRHITALLRSSLPASETDRIAAAT